MQWCSVPWQGYFASCNWEVPWGTWEMKQRLTAVYCTQVVWLTTACNSNSNVLFWLPWSTSQVYRITQRHKIKNETKLFLKVSLNVTTLLLLCHCDQQALEPRRNYLFWLIVSERSASFHGRTAHIMVDRKQREWIQEGSRARSGPRTHPQWPASSK